MRSQPWIPSWSTRMRPPVRKVIGGGLAAHRTPVTPAKAGILLPFRRPRKKIRDSRVDGNGEKRAAVDLKQVKDRLYRKRRTRRSGMAYA